MTRFEAFVDDVVRALPADRRLVARRELLDHLNVAFEEARRDGADDEVAAQRAIAMLGDARRLRHRLWLSDWRRSLEAGWRPALFVLLITIVGPLLAIRELPGHRFWMIVILLFPSLSVASAYWAGLVAVGRMTWFELYHLSVGGVVAWLAQSPAVWVGGTLAEFVGSEEALARSIQALVAFSWTFLALRILCDRGARRLPAAERVGFALAYAVLFTTVRFVLTSPGANTPSSETGWFFFFGLNSLFWLVLAVRTAPLRDEPTVVAAR